MFQGIPQISRTPYISRDATYLKKYRGPPHLPRNTRYVKQDVSDARNFHNLGQEQVKKGKRKGEKRKKEVEKKSAPC